MAQISKYVIYSGSTIITNIDVGVELTASGEISFVVAPRSRAVIYKKSLEQAAESILKAALFEFEQNGLDPFNVTAEIPNIVTELEEAFGKIQSRSNTIEIDLM